MGTVSLVAYLKYKKEDGDEINKEKIHSEYVSVDKNKIESIAVELCADHGFDESSFCRVESDGSTSARFVAKSEKRKGVELELIIKGKEDDILDIEDVGVLE